MTKKEFLESKDAKIKMEAVKDITVSLVDVFKYAFGEKLTEGIMPSEDFPEQVVCAMEKIDTMYGSMPSKYETCVECGESFEITPTEQEFYMSRELDLPKRCADCREKRKQEDNFVCRECGETFTMKQTEKDYYTRHGLDLPKRCAGCREKRRNKKGV